MTLRRNGLGQLGFHVNFEGIVAEVEPYGYAWQAGLRQGSRLVEICKVAVASLSHEQMIDLLRTSVTVKVVIIPPHEDSTPRRYSSETTNKLFINRYIPLSVISEACIWVLGQRWSVFSVYLDVIMAPKEMAAVL